MTAGVSRRDNQGLPAIVGKSEQAVYWNASLSPFRRFRRGQGPVDNETWDTHGNAFPHLKNHLFPPTDRAVSALLDDLHERGLLDRTLIVMAGEFGRTPKVFGLPQAYKLPGRDHWGAVQTVFLAGGGVRGGTVIGSSDNHGGYPVNDPQTPENLAATIYRALGLPATTAWHDANGQPHHIFRGEAIRGLMT